MRRLRKNIGFMELVSVGRRRQADKIKGMPLPHAMATKRSRSGSGTAPEVDCPARMLRSGGSVLKIWTRIQWLCLSFEKVQTWKLYEPNEVENVSAQFQGKITVKMEIELANVLNVKTDELADVAEFMNLLKAKGKNLDVEDMIKCWKKGGIEEDGVVAPIEEKSDAQKWSAAHAVDDLDTKKRRALASGADVGSVFACDICNVVSVGAIPFNRHLAGKRHASMVKMQDL